jgi:signal transduction histidine kinase
MVKVIADQHGGAVVIEDSPLGGARLRVRLPAA